MHLETFVMPNLANSHVIKNNVGELTCPWSSSSLLVSFSLSKLTTWRIHVSPEAGESGWMYTLGGTGESAFPATIHFELW